MASSTSIQLETMHGEWIFSPAVAQIAEMSLDTISAAFKQAQIPLAFGDLPIDREVIKIEIQPRVDLFANPSELIWENGDCQVLFVTERERVHLLFQPRGKVSFELISKEKFLALRHKMNLIPDVFEKAFGFPDYCEQLIESAETFAYEIFSDFGGMGTDVDLLGKDQRNLYMLTRGVYQSYSLPKDKLEKLKAELVSALDARKDLMPRPFIYKRDEVNMHQSLVFRVNAFAMLLQEQGAPIVLAKLVNGSQHVQVKKDARPHHTTRCIFCNPPDKELLFKNDFVHVILNPKPYVGYQEINSKHLLIVPARHIEDCTSASDDELLHERLAVLNLRLEWKKLYPSHEYFVWKQQGIKAGQTAPHVHLQALCAKTSELWQYYRMMIQDICQQVPHVFPPSPDLRKGLAHAQWE